ncbi:hypothetical protein [Blastococcus brunescens]|uniref:Uncharacterized protein n=1 Tax=Blastococcus brunescens TaxID=1564165 RepID=A0ABZ1B6D4_9ACTN|nr:hypothetical protein [Blastococcus sp. BMG 8361]WRL65423.1 hypothetical protein U6N30_07305 [Blastococcus sp. BMG 8361]
MGQTLGETIGNGRATVLRFLEEGDRARGRPVRYIGSSNHAGWQLSKALGVSERHGYQRFIAQQIHYTLQAREAE